MWNSEINEKEFKTQIDSGKNSRYFLSLEKKKENEKIIFLLTRYWIQSESLKISKHSWKPRC